MFAFITNPIGLVLIGVSGYLIYTSGRRSGRNRVRSRRGHGGGRSKR